MVRQEVIDGKTLIYNEDGLLHNEYEPAVKYPNGTKHWYINGKLHREGGPAIESHDGVKFWYKNGIIHREGGPAIESPENQCWIKNYSIQPAIHHIVCISCHNLHKVLHLY